MRQLRAWYFRFAGLFHQQRRERELAEEIESHFQLHIADNLRAGMTPAEARRQARLMFGGIESAKEAYRDRQSVPLLRELWQDLRYAIRILAKDKLFTAVAVITLALGIGANTAIFSLIDAVMLKHLPVRHPEQLMQVTMESGMSQDALSNPLWEAFRSQQDVFSSVFAYDPWPQFNLSAGGEVRHANGNLVSGGFFSTLGVNPALGRLVAPSDDHRGCAAIAALSYSFWQREYGGDPAVLGKTISLDYHPFEVVGVTEPGFFGVEVGRSTEVFAPLCTEPVTHGADSYLDVRHSYPLRVAGRLKPGISPPQVTARLRLLTPGIFDAAADPGQRPYMKPFEARPAPGGMSVSIGHTSLRLEYRDALFTLMAVVVVVLLIACGNVANLLLARAAVRERELAVRLALGSGRGRLIRQLLTESVLLSVSGAALGALLAPLAARVLVRLLSSANSTVFLDLAIDGRVLAFTIAIAVATGVLFGLAPAWRSARIQPYAAIKATARGVVDGSSRFSLGKALVIAQIALSLVLLVAAGLLLETFRRLATLDPGFQRDHVLLVGVDVNNCHYPVENRPAAYREMLERLRSLPGVRSASSSDLWPLTSAFWGQMVVADGSAGKPVGALHNRVSDDYFQTLAMPILAGRGFNPQDSPGSAQVAIINQTLARKLFGEANPVGKRYRNERDEDGPRLSGPIEVVGVVRDSKFNSLREEIQPMVYLPQRQEKEPEAFISLELLTANSPAELIPGVKAVMARMNSGIALEFVSLSAQVEASLARERMLAALSSFFGGLALLLAAIGLYGVISYNLTRRRNEIGIRVALGAEQGRIRRLVLGEVAVLVCVGLAAGMAGSLAAAHLISAFLFGLTPADPATLALATALLAIVAVIAGYLPARRASRMDPMLALREE